MMGMGTGYLPMPSARVPEVPPDIQKLSRSDAAAAQIEWLGPITGPEFQRRYDALGAATRLETLVRLYWNAVDEGNANIVTLMRGRLFGRIEKGRWIPGEILMPIWKRLRSWNDEPEVMEDLRSKILRRVLQRIENRTKMIAQDTVWTVHQDCNTEIREHLQRVTNLVELKDADPDTVVDEGSLGADVEDLLNRIDVRRLLERLPPLQRQAVELRYLEGLQWGTIADGGQRTVASVMGIEPDQARYLCNMGLAALRKFLHDGRQGTDAEGA